MSLIEQPASMKPEVLLDLSRDQMLRTPEPQFQDVDLESELIDRFSAGALGSLSLDYLRDSFGEGWRDAVGDRQFVVSYIDGMSPYSDIGRSVETSVFAKRFRFSLSDVYRDYVEYDPNTTFTCVIDVSTPIPTPAASLRIVKYTPEIGLKDIRDLVADSPKNPWRSEIDNLHFGSKEQYDPEKAWIKLQEAAGVRINLDSSLDIATHASGPEYSGQHGSIQSASMLFYHACLRFALAERKENLVAIFDLPPFANLQQFGDPFDTYEGLKPHPYGGPFDTIPAYCVLEEGMKRIRNKDEVTGQVFIDGLSLDELALMPNEYESGTYSNSAVGL